MEGELSDRVEEGEANTRMILHDAYSLSQEDFCRKYDHPFLVGSPVERQGRSPFQTLSGVSVEETRANGVVMPCEKRGTIVYPVAKRGGSNAFTNMVCLGRAPNNDIVLPDPRVSKLHAILSRDGDQWYIQDRSTNGTDLKGTHLPKGKKQVLEDCAVLTLCGAERRLTFMYNGSLWQAVKSGAIERDWQKS